MHNYPIYLQDKCHTNVTNIIFEPHLDSICLTSNLFFRPVQAGHNMHELSQPKVAREDWKLHVYKQGTTQTGNEFQTAREATKLHVVSRAY